MAKLYFRYGAMGSSKTANALMVRYNYLEKGQHPLLLKPKKENRDGKTTIKSRIGIEAECYFIEDFIEATNHPSQIPHPSFCLSNLDAIIVDEAQFLSKGQVDFLSDIVDDYNIPVLCYGLRTDFLSNFFEGSQRLMEIADVIDEVPTVCWCGKKAQFNARISNNKIVRAGEQFELGGNESYVSLCRKHYKEGRIKKDDY